MTDQGSSKDKQPSPSGTDSGYGSDHLPSSNTDSSPSSPARTEDGAQAQFSIDQAPTTNHENSSEKDEPVLDQDSVANPAIGNVGDKRENSEARSIEERFLHVIDRTNDNIMYDWDSLSGVFSDLFKLLLGRGEKHEYRLTLNEHDSPTDWLAPSDPEIEKWRKILRKQNGRFKAEDFDDGSGYYDELNYVDQTYRAPIVVWPDDHGQDDDDYVATFVGYHLGFVIYAEKDSIDKDNINETNWTKTNIPVALRSVWKDKHERRRSSPAATWPHELEYTIQIQSGYISRGRHDICLLNPLALKCQLKAGAIQASDAMLKDLGLENRLWAPSPHIGQEVTKPVDFEPVSVSLETKYRVSRGIVTIEYVYRHEDVEDDEGGEDGEDAS